MCIHPFYILKDGVPTHENSIKRWKKWTLINAVQNGPIAEDKINEKITVRTYFTGFNSLWETSQEKSLLFECIVLGEETPFNGMAQRYETEEEARIGHIALVTLMRNKVGP